MATENQRLRFLLIDDNPDDRLLARRELQKEFSNLQIIEINNMKSLKEALEAGDFDLVVTDFQLRWTDGLKVLAAVRERYPACPVVMFTGTGSEEVAVKAMKSGLNDYVLKAANHYLKLPAAVRSALANAEERRQRQYMEQQFYQAQKMEAVGHLAGGVAHDINNVLSAVIGYSELLLIGVSLEDPRGKYLQEIRSAGLRAKEITQQLLAFSRKQVLDLRSLKLDEQVELMLNMLRRLIGEDIDLHVSHASDLKPIRADATQVQQVLLNLAVNARDAMQEGGRLRIATMNAPADQIREDFRGEASHFVLLVVEDNGHGMDAETKAKIFEPFFTTKVAGQGTGLGLATVHGIVTQHGGWCEVESSPGEGARFLIYFPGAKGDEQALAISSRAEERPVGSESVLIVEDDDAVRAMVARVLSLHGYSVLEASHADGAVQQGRLHRNELCLLITDVIMPKMNGKELYKELKSSNPDLKVLYMSGYPQEVISSRGELDDGVRFVQKPFSMSSLLQKVREVLDTTG